MTLPIAGAQIHSLSQANQIAPGTAPRWRTSPYVPRPVAALPNANESPPRRSCPPIGLAGRRLSRMAPAVANESAGAPSPIAPTRSDGPANAERTRLAASESSETSHIAPTAAEVRRLVVRVPGTPARDGSARSCPPSYQPPERD